MVSTDGPVEGWMQAVEGEMVRTLRTITKEAVYSYARGPSSSSSSSSPSSTTTPTPTSTATTIASASTSTPRLAWIAANLGMVSIVATQIWWTWEVEDSFRSVRSGLKTAVKQLAIKLTSQLNDLVAGIRDSGIGAAHRKKLTTLIIIDVHARDIVDKFVRDSILDSRDFAWSRQLRVYWDRDADDISIAQCSGSFAYGYEYQGLSGRLVITPLTDRCYMTLTQALTFHMGGSPAGPAGTGKSTRASRGGERREEERKRVGEREYDRCNGLRNGWMDCNVAYYLFCPCFSSFFFSPVQVKPRR